VTEAWVQAEAAGRAPRLGRVSAYLKR
jgi:hypothetical protein